MSQRRSCDACIAHITACQKVLLRLKQHLAAKKIKLVALDYASLEASYQSINQSVSKTLDPLNKYFLKFSNNFSEGILSFLLLS